MYYLFVLYILYCGLYKHWEILSVCVSTNPLALTHSLCGIADDLSELQAFRVTAWLSLKEETKVYMQPNIPQLRLIIILCSAMLEMARGREDHTSCYIVHLFGVHMSI